MVGQDQRLDRRDVSSHRECVGLAGSGGGAKSTVALLAPASLHPLAGGGWKAGTAVVPVFLSSHRPKIAAGLNAGFFSNHFSSDQLHKGQPPSVHHRAR